MTRADYLQKLFDHWDRMLADMLSKYNRQKLRYLIKQDRKNDHSIWKDC